MEYPREDELPWHLATVGCRIDYLQEVYTQDMPEEYSTHFYNIKTSPAGDLLSDQRTEFVHVAELIAADQFDLNFSSSLNQGSVAQQVLEEEDLDLSQSSVAQFEGNARDPIVIDDTLPDLDSSTFPEGFDPGLGSLGWAPLAAQPIVPKVKPDPEAAPRPPVNDHADSVFNRGNKSDGKGGKAKGKVYLPNANRLSHDMRGKPLPSLVSVISMSSHV